MNGLPHSDDDWSPGILARYKRVHFSRQRLSSYDGYDGPASTLNDAEAVALLAELLERFGIDDLVDPLPPPPLGLIGSKDDSYVEPGMKVIRLGVEYLVALVQSRPGRQADICRRAADMLRRSYRQGRDEATQAFEARDAEEWKARMEEPLPQYDPEAERQRGVYFIGAEGGNIKIGVSIDPKKRLRSLQIQNAAALTMLAVTSGGIQREREYHHQFAALRRHGEWFERHPDILAEIERLNSGAAA